jgi:hypothetical protein
MIKCTGAEWLRFYDDKDFWPEDAWHEGELLIVNGVNYEEGEHDLSSVHADAVMRITGGVVYGLPEDSVSLETHFKRWKRKQATTTFVVEIPNTDIEYFKAQVKICKGKIL